MGDKEIYSQIISKTIDNALEQISNHTVSYSELGKAISCQAGYEHDHLKDARRLGINICRIFSKCQTDTERAVADDMLVSLTGYGFSTFIRIIQERKEEKEMEMG
jgi:hypothetical protein